MLPTLRHHCAMHFKIMFDSTIIKNKYSKKEGHRLKPECFGIIAVNVILLCIATLSNTFLYLDCKTKYTIINDSFFALVRGRFDIERQIIT